MRMLLKNLGNGASVRSPKSILRSLRLRVDNAAEVREESARIVIELLQRKRFEFAELLDEINLGNVHRETDF